MSEPLCAACGAAIAGDHALCSVCDGAVYCLACAPAHFCTIECPARGCRAGLCVRLVHDGVLAETWGVPEA